MIIWVVNHVKSKTYNVWLYKPKMWQKINMSKTSARFLSRELLQDKFKLYG